MSDSTHRPGPTRQVVRFAPAKINLNLLVGPAGPDGYHPLDSYVAQLDFADRVELTPRDDGRIVLQAAGLDCGPAESNLAVLAAEAAGRELGCVDRGVTIRLDKRIAPGMGLGGGSSDAAAVLVGLAELWELEWSPADLSRTALSLGADVPLFLAAPAVRMQGRGERLCPIQLPRLEVLLILPELFCSTGDVYAAFDADPPGRQQQLPAERLTRSVDQWRGDLFNQLLPAAVAVCPELGCLRRRLGAALPAPVHLTGSGAGLFVLPAGPAESAACQAELGSLGLKWIRCRAPSDRQVCRDFSPDFRTGLDR
jgi:4-diphosphocytidyl-2-C-methyl-D-erythritol kinase